MGLCAPAVVAANAALEQSTPYDSLVVIPGQFIEMAGVFQLMGRIGQRREGHAVPCKANARNAAGDRGGDGGGYFNAGEGDHCVWGGQNLGPNPIIVQGFVGILPDLTHPM